MPHGSVGQEFGKGSAEQVCLQDLTQLQSGGVWSCSTRLARRRSLHVVTGSLHRVSGMEASESWLSYTVAQGSKTRGGGRGEEGEKLLQHMY